MINVVIKSNGVNVPDSLINNIESLLRDIDLSSYKIRRYSLYVIFDMDNDSLKHVLDLEGGNKFILFQNLPKETNYDIAFEATLSKFRIRLQRFNEIDVLSYNNVVFVFDFSQFSVQHSNKEEMSNVDDRRSMFFPIEPKYKMNSVVMSNDMRSEIENALSIIRNRDRIYNDWGFQNIDPQARAVLSFYGPGGTGKTKCAHAVASALGRKILCVNYANIESMWAGESPKNLIAAFNVAQESNAVLFMDEADSFLGKRITNVTSGHDQSINSLRSQMLILLEEFEGVVIFGTNLVGNFDKAFETRILKNIKFDLPDESLRVKLFKLMIPTEVPFNVPLTETDFLEFAKDSEGFSGREIKNTVLETLSKGAKNNVNSFTAQMFNDAILCHAESLKQLEKEKLGREIVIEEALKESILTESERLYHEALIHVAIYAMKADGGASDDKEKHYLSQLAKLLDIDIANLDEENISTLPVVREHFSTKEQKEKALNLACKMIAIDNTIIKQELVFLKNLYCILGFDVKTFSNIEKYVSMLKKTNCMSENLIG